MLLLVLLPSCPFLSVVCHTELLHCVFYFFHQLSSQFKQICCCCRQLHKPGLCWNITSTSNYEKEISRGFFITYYTGFVPLRLRLPPSMHSVFLDMSSMREIYFKNCHIIKFRSCNQHYKLPLQKNHQNYSNLQLFPIPIKEVIKENKNQTLYLLNSCFKYTQTGSALACKLTLLSYFLSLEENCGQYIHATR